MPAAKALAHTHASHCTPSLPTRACACAQVQLVEPFPLLHWFFWLELLILAATGIFWMLRMNQALSLYDPLFISMHAHTPPPPRPHPTTTHSPPPPPTPTSHYSPPPSDAHPLLPRSPVAAVVIHLIRCHLRRHLLPRVCGHAQRPSGRRRVASLHTWHVNDPQWARSHRAATTGHQTA